MDASPFDKVPNVINTVRPGILHGSRMTNETAYNTTHKRIGRALIFNQETFKFGNDWERQGSTKDADDLSKVFKEFGFEVFVHKDLMAQGIKDILTEGKKIKRKYMFCKFIR